MKQKEVKILNKFKKVKKENFTAFQKEVFDTMYDHLSGEDDYETFSKKVNIWGSRFKIEKALKKVGKFK